MLASTLVTPPEEQKKLEKQIKESKHTYSSDILQYHVQP